MRDYARSVHPLLSARKEPGPAGDPSRRSLPDARAARVFDARYGYLLKYNIPVSKGSQNPSSAPPAKQNPPPPPAPPREDASQNRPVTPRAVARVAVQTTEAHDAIPVVAAPAPPRSVGPTSRPPRRIRPSTKNGPMRGRPAPTRKDMCKNCYMGHGAHAPKHEGKSRRDLGNPCRLVCRAPDCERRRECHWGRDCPNKNQLPVRPNRASK